MTEPEIKVQVREFLERFQFDVNPDDLPKVIRVLVDELATLLMRAEAYEKQRREGSEH